MKATIVVFALAVVSMGCATSYRPQEPGRIAFVLDGPGFSLYKNGERYGAMGLSSAPIRAVAGNPLAEDHARTYVKRSRVGWTLYGIAIASLVTSIALNASSHAHGEQRQAGLIFGHLQRRPERGGQVARAAREPPGSAAMAIRPHRSAPARA